MGIAARCYIGSYPEKTKQVLQCCAHGASMSTIGSNDGSGCSDNTIIAGGGMCVVSTMFVLVLAD